jgi:hypothetical protein
VAGGDEYASRFTAFEAALAEFEKSLTFLDDKGH